MNRAFVFALLSLLSFPALGQTTIPTCNTFDAAGHPAILLNGAPSTNCTDYFGVANWANSPLPVGPVSSTFTVMSSGSGYTNPTVTVTDFYGASGATGALATATVTNGSISAVQLTAAGSGYVAPVVMVTDPTGSGAAILASIDPAGATGGIRKFVDALPDLKGALAAPDTTTFQGSDFYVIELVQYTTQMHSDLPPTTLRGYCQLLSNGTCTPQYLGPVLLAQKNRAVRVLFKNMLPTGTGGNLFIPVDTTFMGAGSGPDGQIYTQNRGTLHLHGGASPWISDGTPHQWTAPASENTTHGRGLSTQFVPDMWFDATGAVIGSCAGLTSCPVAGATTDPGPGAMTFYWTNQQGGRLMFYHDHSYGITRLNVYAGEAAGYLLYDPAEEAALLAATAPGTIATNAAQTAPDLGHLIPLVIQDKTFVPNAGQLAGEDPTWMWGTSSTTLAANGATGDLWFPHVYMTNQNPNDFLGGANGLGRWDYGPWFFPPQNVLTAANPPSAVTIPCTSSAFPGQTLGPTPADVVGGCPITPNPSGTPEAFMDTPIINGKAYPVLHVAPEAYRFQVLAAGNDRSWNLQLYKADPTNSKEVAMLPAVPPSTGSGLPLCNSLTSITQPGLGLGLATATLDASGNPLNGTGLPAGCWPNYGAPSPGIPSKQFMWPADGRDGGVPDPRNAGPPFIQIGTEGGLLPNVAVIPSTPAGFEYNTRSITVTNVSSHGLWLGPAERADVIVDFSKFSGQTLILYNDAPAPVPAFDSRVDYYTGDVDQAIIGGAPTTLPGYGPNTRTLMQIVVDQAPSAQVAFNLPTLAAALPTAFEATQPTPIVPEPTYPVNSGGNISAATYSRIQDNTITFTPCQSSLPGGCQAGTLPPITVTYDQKAIQELFTLDYGRMNATMGVELPFTNFTTQTTIPYGYVDWPTELIKDGDTQIWKITHNGVDTHFVHFHLFNVQVLNRMGWDGTVRPPDQNELGWKDTVRMNPLEDIVVALQPVKPTLPWPVPDSIRPMDVTMPTGMPDPSISGINPFNNGATSTTNALVNFGWEYVWHCHILGHEENDMMRPVIFQVAPAVPTNLSAIGAAAGGVMITWTDNSASESGFTLERDVDPLFPNPVVLFTNANASVPNTAFGGTLSYLDATTPAGQVYYRMQAVDDFTPKSPLAAPFQTTTLVSPWTPAVPFASNPIITASPAALAFGNVLVGSTAGPLAITLSNTGTAPLNILGLGLTGANISDFALPASANPCGATLNPTASCSIAVTFAPLTVGARLAAVTITSNDPVNPTLSVSLSGFGIANTALSISAPAIPYGSNASVTVSVTSTQVTPVTGSVTLSVDGGAPLIQALVGGSATFTLVTPSAPSHTLSAVFAAQGGFGPSSNSGTLFVTPAALTITASSAVMTYGGAAPAITPSFSGFVLGQSQASLGGTLTCSATATSTSPVGSYPTTCSGATSTNYAITYVAGTVTVGKATSATAITSNLPNPAIVGQVVTATVAVTPQFTGTPTGSVIFTASTGETCPATLTLGRGSCQFIFGTGGARTLTAAYGGNGNFLASTSTPVSQVVSSVSLSSTSLLFGNQRMGTTSANQTVTLSNVGTTPLAITSITRAGTSPGDFVDTTNCPIGGNLAAGRSCRVNVAFRPTAAGVRSATLVITDSDATSPQTVSLTGTGVSGPFGTLSVTALPFGSVRVGQSSAPSTVTLTNTGGSPLIINNIRNPGNTAQFPYTTTCTFGGAGLAPGANCTVTVQFSPTRRAALAATLTFNDNGTNSPQTVALTGTGF